ncbi:MULTISPECIES: 3-oxoacyl-[acyl-carrier-protein] synthase III C-terminal domain-containing protein [unclassified Streptomyces]|uniref:3-oxoacyl-[acyl-carrier-protein] synthase III C-terminal domain-containing protein n=1 Tax=unclassified Streptomyces TaxID=2593676 RepID=UPI00081DA21C|nr:MULTISPECIES: 3-oxoacyl-[acyl-carrier-protein] synthase III C-terminal domain-containing protein [unclassified Streptomyces]SCE47953.1 3-oxoacyl-[acyl-carrier-protein] synthase-3 [Streptomyces sp. DpondAA-F4a]
MRFDNIWIAGTGGTLGAFEPVAAAVADGRYSADAAESSAMVSYARSDQAPPEMAVTAGRQAVKEAEERGVRVDGNTALLHSHGHFQGIDLWPAACWIAGELLGPQLDSMPTTVNAWSNGSLAALDVAASTLMARPDVPSALITLADRFAPPTDRFHTSPGMVFGDGAAAGVVSRDTGRLRLRSLVSRTDTVLEGLVPGDRALPHRARGAAGHAPQDARVPRLGGSLAEGRAHPHRRLHPTRGRPGPRRGRHHRRRRRLVPDPLRRPDPVPGELRTPLGITPRNTVHELGLTIGHLGPCDQMYGLDHLLRNNLPATGDRILVIGTGMGFTFSAAVLTADGV